MPLGMCKLQVRSEVMGTKTRFCTGDWSCWGSQQDMWAEVILICLLPGRGYNKAHTRKPRPLSNTSCSSAQLSSPCCPRDARRVHVQCPPPLQLAHAHKLEPRRTHIRSLASPSSATAAPGRERAARRGMTRCGGGHTLELLFAH